MHLRVVLKCENDLLSVLVCIGECFLHRRVFARVLHRRLFFLVASFW